MKGPLATLAAPVGHRYKANEWIGAGGMQHVYLAFDTLFERNVALKTPKDDSGYKRFEQSAVVSARVNQENVAKTLDYFVDNDRPYLVEELVYGADMYAVMSTNLPFLPPSTCARILHQLAKGLASSHDADVVHRDLKPSNIMVVNGPMFTNVKITDFGIAKMAEEEIGEWAEVGGATSSKTVLGAIPYMSPEAIENFKIAKKSSDVWAIAAIVYELMSGELPFGTGLKAIPKIVVAAPPKKPSQINGSQFRDLGGQLFEILLSCFQKDETLRPTASELAARCSDLCYSITRYGFGEVTDTSGYTWRIRDDEGGRLMAHQNSVYGQSRIKTGARVWFGRDPGHPWDRAFPIVKAREAEGH